MAEKEVKAYVYENTGDEQDIEGVGLVRAGEQITVPYKKIDHKDLRLVKTVTSFEEVESKKKVKKEE